VPKLAQHTKQSMQTPLTLLLKASAFRTSLFTSLALLALTGCASHYGAATIVSTPSGAEVIDKETEEVIGVTPFTMHWKNGNGTRETVTLELSKAGYYNKTSAFWLDMRERNAKAARKQPIEVEIEMQKIGEQ